MSTKLAWLSGLVIVIPSVENDLLFNASMASRSRSNLFTVAEISYSRDLKPCASRFTPICFNFDSFAKSESKLFSVLTRAFPSSGRVFGIEISFPTSANLERNLSIAASILLASKVSLFFGSLFTLFCNPSTA